MVVVVVGHIQSIAVAVAYLHRFDLLRDEQAPPELPLWVIDLGHRTTHICAVAPHPSRSGQVLVSFARTIARVGGVHHLGLLDVAAQTIRGVAKPGR